MNNTLFVFATLYPKEQSFEKAKEILKSLVEKTIEESGCIEFTLHMDLELKKLYLYEEWDDEDALAKHFTFEYTKDAVDLLKDYLEKQTDVVKMEKIK